MEYTAFNKIIVRTPLLPCEMANLLFNLNQNNECINAIFEQFKYPNVKEALFISSPDLYYSFVDILSGKISDKGQIISIASSLLKYYIRMTSRATPFGLMAGCAVAEISEKTNIEFDTNLSASKHTRLDMNYTCALAKEVSKQGSVRTQLLYFPNSSLYNLGEKIRFVERKYQETNVSYHITQIDINEYILKIIENAKSGKKIKELAKLLLNEEINLDEATQFIFELIDSQIIVDNLEPSVCGDEFIVEFLNNLKTIDPETQIILNEKHFSIKNFILKLENILNHLQAIDNKSINEISDYENVFVQLKDFGVSFQSNRIFQTDLVRKINNNTLSLEVISELKKCLKVINKLNIRHKKIKLDAFANDFTAHYEDQSVSLLHVLDPEYGIGYAQKSEKGTDEFLNPTEAFLYKKLKSLEQNNILKLCDQDLKNFDDNWDDMPDTMASMFELYVDNGNPVICVSGISGSSGANLIGRFCHADSEIDKLVMTIVDKEEELKSENIIYGEINHITEARTGNILARPNLRKYEIPFLAKSTINNEAQLNLQDLYISVNAGRIIIKSKKNKKIVIPRLTNAHNFNYGSTQPIYQFLGDMQTYYDTPSALFSWGKLELLFNHLPRLTYNNHIIALEKWAINENTINLLTKSKDEKLIEEIENWRRKNEIPQRIVLVEGDNKLLIDLKNPISALSFISSIKNKKQVIIEENLIDSFDSPISDTSGQQFVNQIIVPFYKSEICKEKHNLFKSLNQNFSRNIGVQRNYVPGDEWIYFKIYCGAKTANDLILNLVQPFLNNTKIINLIEKWFFIRYADPDRHFRIRFKVKEKINAGLILNEFYEFSAPFVKNNQIKKIVLDTYSRELERYGANTMELSENLFCINSEFVINVLNVFEDENLIWLTAIKYIDGLLNNFQFDLSLKKQLMESLSDSFGKEFNKDITLKKTLGNRYRNERKDIKNIIEEDNLLTEESQIIIHLCNQSIKTAESDILHILEIKSKNELIVGIENLLSSYIHMFLNRLFIENQRYHEMVLYHMIWHHYKSELAREKSILIPHEVLN